MKIEHTAYQVADPPALARWYVAHLGLAIKRSQDASPFGYFLADEGDAVMLEFYHQPDLPVPDYRAIDPLICTWRSWTDDVPATRARLLAAGATAEGDVIHKRSGRRGRDAPGPVGTSCAAAAPSARRAMLASCRT